MRVCVCFCLHAGSPCKMHCIQWTMVRQSSKAIAKITVRRGPIQSISGFCPTPEGKTRLERGMEEERGEEEINGKCQGFFWVEHLFTKKKKINPMPFFLRIKPKRTLKWHWHWWSKCPLLLSIKSERRGIKAPWDTSVSLCSLQSKKQW